MKSECVALHSLLKRGEANRERMMKVKKVLLSLWPFLFPVLLLLLLLGNGMYRELTDSEEATGQYTGRPAIMYNDQMYLMASSKLFPRLSKESLTVAGKLAEDVSHMELNENMQSSGCADLVGSSIYISEEYGDYLFLYDSADQLIPFVLE